MAIKSWKDVKNEEPKKTKIKSARDVLGTLSSSGKSAQEYKTYADAMKSSRLMEIESKKKQEGIDAAVAFSKKLADSGKKDTLSLNMGPINQDAYNRVTKARQDEITKRADDAARAIRGDTAASKRLDMKLSTPLSPEENELFNQMVEARRGELYREERDNSGLRKNPYVGWAYRGIDRLADTTKPFSELAQEYYTPGAGLNVITGLTRGAEYGVSKALPGLARTALSQAPQGASFFQKSLPTLAKVGQTSLAEGIVGIPLQAANTLTRTGDLEQSAKEGLMYGGLGGAVLGGAGRAIGEGVQGLRSFTNNSIQDVVRTPLLAPSAIERANALPQYAGRLKLDNKAENVSRIIEGIRPEVNELMTPPLENPSELRKWVAPHLGNPSMKELSKLTYDDLIELSNEIRSGMNVYDTAVEVAKRRGINLPKAFEKAPSIKEIVAQDASFRAYGFPTPELPNARRPIVNEAINPRAVKALETTEEVISTATKRVDETPSQTPLSRPQVDDTTVVSGSAYSSAGSKMKSDELAFAQTVKSSETTDPSLLKLLEENPMTGSRTSNALNLQVAGNLIKRHGAEKLTNMIVSKKGTLNAAENTAAHILAKYYSGLGGDNNLSKSIDLISKTARGGRELGQAVQALSLWNRLDQEGATMLAERQLNRRVSNTEDWQSLTPEQAKPVQKVGRGLEDIQTTRNLADEVVKMLANRGNVPLTAGEKQLVSQFRDLVERVNEQVKPLLRKERVKRSDTMKQVRSIPPKERTRDQVLSYLEAQADDALRQWKAKRNIGFAQKISQPDIVLLTKIGAYKLAKGIVKFADWSESMIKDGITEGLPKLYTNSVKIFRKENGLPTNDELNRVVNQALKDSKINDETANSLRAMASEIGLYADDAKRELTQDLQRTIRSLGSSTLGEKISATQTGAMLLNVPTFLRNAIGNIEQITIEKMNKLAAVPIDWTFSKLTGNRTIQFFPQNQEKFWRNFWIGTKSGYEGISPTGTLSSYDLSPEVFKSKYNPLRYLVKATGASLQGMDYAAYNAAYGDFVATYAEQLGKSKGLTKEQIKAQMPDLIKQLDDSVQQMADQAGLYATYQDETLLSRAAQKVKSGLNKPTDAFFKSLREKGLIKEGASLEGFGLGDIVLKFTRTPANLVMRGIDYSPLGFARGLFELTPLVFGKTNRFNQVAATRALSRAITGTLGFTGLGYVLAQNGILTGAASSDIDKRSLQEQSGQGAYKVNWSALGRWMKSGFNSDAAKFQEGDVLMDYAWMQPAAISLGMGVNAAESVNKPLKPGEERKGFDVALSALTGGLRTVLENPMVTGLTNVIDATTSAIKYQDASKYGDLVKGVPASFVPAVVGQARTATDNEQRETYDANILKNMLNLVKNKIPGLSKQLPLSYGSLGQPRERIQGGESGSLGQYLNAFLNPAKITNFEVSPEAKLVLDVLEESSDSSVLPRIAQKYILVDKKTEGIKNMRMNLTAKQFSKLQREMGEKVSEEIRKKSSYLSDPNVDVDKKAKLIKDILTNVGSESRNVIRVESGYDKKK